MSEEKKTCDNDKTKTEDVIKAVIIITKAILEKILKKKGKCE